MAAAQQAALAHDLSRTLMQFLDVHLSLPILEMVQERGLYDEEDVLRAKLALLDRTNMVRDRERLLRRRGSDQPRTSARAKRGLRGAGGCSRPHRPRSHRRCRLRATARAVGG